MIFQACIITRSRAKAIDVWHMDPAQGMWYILETNYDHWKKPFFLDDRRTPAHKCMNQLSQKVILTDIGIIVSVSLFWIKQ